VTDGKRGEKWILVGKPEKWPDTEGTQAVETAQQKNQSLRGYSTEDSEKRNSWSTLLSLSKMSSVEEEHQFKTSRQIERGNGQARR